MLSVCVCMTPSAPSVCVCLAVQGVAGAAEKSKIQEWPLYEVSRHGCLLTLERAYVRHKFGRDFLRFHIRLHGSPEGQVKLIFSMPTSARSASPAEPMVMDREARGAATELEADLPQHAAVGHGDASSCTAHAELPGKRLRGSSSTSAAANESAGGGGHDRHVLTNPGDRTVAP